MPVDPNLPVVGGDIGAWGDKLNAAQQLVADEINNHEAATDPHGDRAYADEAKLDKSQNLGDLEDSSAARTALGLGTAAQNNSSDFVTPVTVAQTIADALAANRPVNL